MSSALKNILIIKPSALGDVVTALPALAALRQSFPEVRISWLVRPEFATLLQGHPFIDEIIYFDRRFLGKAWYNPKAASALLKLISLLRDRDFDLIMDFQGLFRTAFLGWLSGCKKRIGMKNARELAPLFYTDKVSQPTDSAHVIDHYLKMVKTITNTDVSAQFVFPQNQQAKLSVDELLSSNHIKSKNYAVFIPGSAHRSKCWPAEKFASLAQKIKSQFGFSIVAVGVKSERPMIEKIISRATVPITNLADQTNLPELVALLKQAAVVITNDTGPGHIAAAMGGPLVMIFGPSNPVRLFPYNRADTIAAVEPFKRGSKLQSTDPAHSMEAISVDHVYRILCWQLKAEK
jgi:lipopolysaccharide heptosyltransferase I